MKKIIALMLALVMVIGLCACTVEVSTEPPDREPSRFYFVEQFDMDNGYCRVYVDAETGVMYGMFSTHAHSYTGFSPLYNADGSIMIWEEKLE